jgi:hypothetical protein
LRKHIPLLVDPLHASKRPKVHKFELWVWSDGEDAVADGLDALVNDQVVVVDGE